MGQQQ
jgi:hypothetical protein